MSAAALDLSTTSNKSFTLSTRSITYSLPPAVHQFWDKVVAANPNLEAVVKAANSKVLYIVSNGRELHIFAVNITGIADNIPTRIPFGMQVQFSEWPWLPSNSRGLFMIEFKVNLIDITVYDPWHFIIWSGTAPASVPPFLVGLTIEGIQLANSNMF
ncbi:hypothetical protein BXZ70DRAFT_911016 [Cristinia sonorae]|uniref:Uncharacterized protein n=1 Tax=Cristinia sonorae TaxID=1940300 RepID=A0A8K0UG74_9AGAR|nr:hypothetical protein BXZ70DRAFT_911016 [Cristinia sonorae]